MSNPGDTTSTAATDILSGLGHFFGRPAFPVAVDRLLMKVEGYGRALTFLAFQFDMAFVQLDQ